MKEYLFRFVGWLIMMLGMYGIICLVIWFTSIFGPMVAIIALIVLLAALFASIPN